MSKEINALIAKNQKIVKEIDDIQNQCDHKDQNLKQVRERLDSTVTVVRWVCEDCKKILRVPSPQETIMYLSNE